MIGMINQVNFILRPYLYGLGYPRQPSPPSYPGRANFSLKSLKDSIDRLYDPARVVSGGRVVSSRQVG